MFIFSIFLGKAENPSPIWNNRHKKSEVGSPHRDHRGTGDEFWIKAGLAADYPARIVTAVTAHKVTLGTLTETPNFSICRYDPMFSRSSLASWRRCSQRCLCLSVCPSPPVFSHHK
ncbi:hypothetical protein E2C01_099570 [Portunus trituberculatus]|uniref:Uncharacterized protein n=1 Tax=Portunus trituberculatus TaxID=210409 RepID=A0A5B7K0M9_PORTR|nr:hypothetical protein [Portunus trituberculatus]